MNPIQKRKITHLFNVLDVNRNKELQPDDFIAVANRISDLLEYPEKSRKRVALQVRSFRLFVQLLADLQKEETSITFDEWMRLFTVVLLKNEQIIKNYVRRTTAYIFMLFDHNNDHVVSEEEYINMFKVYNIDEEYARIAFKKLDENQDGVLSQDEVISGFHDFFLSGDSAAKGNWIFGKWDLEE